MYTPENAYLVTVCPIVMEHQCRKFGIKVEVAVLMG